MLKSVDHNMMAMPTKRGEGHYVLYALVTVFNFFPSANSFFVSTKQTIMQNSACAYCFCESEDDCKKRACCHRVSDNLLTPLHVELNCSQPHLSYIIDNQKSTPASQSHKCSGFRLEITSEQTCLTALPRNLCDFPDIRAVTVSGTSLMVFPDLSCLSKLELLDMSKNMLRSVPRDAFSGLSMIMEIKLDYNQIEYIHPNAFDDSFNRIQLMANTLNETLDPDAQYGPGYVSLTHNNITQSPVLFLKKTGLFNQFLLWAKFHEWGFDFRDNPFFCDCDFYEIRFWIKFASIVMSRGFFNITCETPLRFKGQRLIDIPPDELTCDVTVNCPENCTCLRRAKERDTIVNCNGSGLSELPFVIPEGNLTLVFANNFLEGLPSREYFARTVNLDVSGNRIHHIEQEVPRLLKFKVKSVDLQHNSLLYLPRTFQVLKPDTVFLDPNTLICTCDLDWFPTWAQQSVSPRYDHVHCTTERGHVVLLHNSTRDDLGCDPGGADTAYKLSLISVTVVLVVLMVVMVMFRNEALVLSHAVTARIKRRKPSAHRAGPAPIYDVFLSTAVSDADTSWVSEVLLPLLSEHGLTCYWPTRDCLPGTVEMEEVTKRLHDSQSALVVVSHDYINSPASLFQFGQAYNRMMKHGQGRLILLLQGAFRRKSITEPRLRAMVTLRMAHKTCRPRNINKVLGKLSATLNTGGLIEDVDIGRG